MEIFLRPNLRYLRKKNGLSQAQLAEELGVTRNMIVSYETTKVEPKLTVLLKISTYFQIRLSSLLNTELSDDNYEEEKKYFTLNKSHLHQIEMRNLDSNPEALAKFNKEITRIEQIYTGLQALYLYKEEKGNLDASTKDLMLLVDELLKSTKKFMESAHDSV